MIRIFITSSSSFYGFLTSRLNEQIRVGLLLSSVGRARTRLNFLFATAKDASITSSSLNLTLTLYHCFCIVGSYAILMCGVLDFSLYYTHDNSPCGLPLQNVSLNLFFLFYNNTSEFQKNPHFQNEVKFKTFLEKISFSISKAERLTSF